MFAMTRVAMAVKAVAAAPGQVVITTTGTSDWVVPAGVTSICVVCVETGGNTVAQGTQITRADGTTVLCRARNGARIGDGGGDGGLGGHGGGGAGGYSGAGGRGQYVDSYTPRSQQAGSGGGGGGGGAGGVGIGQRGAGGGVGLLGQGSNGAAGSYSTYTGFTAAGGGSAGANGGFTQPYVGDGPGGQYGGGAGWTQVGYTAFYHNGGALSYKNNIAVSPGETLKVTIQAKNIVNQGAGGVRIIWGAGRAYPSTLTGNL